MKKDERERRDRNTIVDISILKTSLKIHVKDQTTFCHRRSEPSVSRLKPVRRPENKHNVDSFVEGLVRIADKE